jgi:hypothetical protein
MSDLSDVLLQPPVVLTPTDVANQILVERFNQRLFLGRAFNLQSTSDQALTKIFTGTAYSITSVIAVCKSGGATVVCAGGIYTATSKGGNALVAAAQSWIGLSAANKRVSATLASIVDTDIQTATPIYFSLTTGSTAAATADVFVFGVVLD